MTNIFVTSCFYARKNQYSGEGINLFFVFEKADFEHQGHFEQQQNARRMVEYLQRFQDMTNDDEEPKIVQPVRTRNFSDSGYSSDSEGKFF